MSRFLVLASMVMMGTAHAAQPNPGPASPGPTGFELTLVDMQGQKKVLGTLPATILSPRISPDGKRVAFELADPPPASPQETRLYVAELDKLDKRQQMQVPVTTTRLMAPVWSDDGDWLVFLATGNGPDALYRQKSDGYIQPLFVVEGRAPEGWYKDGRLVFITRTGDTDYGISALDMATKKVTRLVDIAGSEQHSSRISPDGKWLAYASSETGRQEVWLEPLPQTGKRFQLTKQGGRHPVWSPDSTKLYFDQDGKMFRLDLTPGETPSVSEPAQLPISGFQQGERRRQFDITPDGKSFLMLFPVRAAP
jgi:eukaryotic-like serine/threonine-protein kinase